AGLEAEIGDGLEGQTASFVVGNHSWTVQKEWSNLFGRGIVANGSKAAMLDVPVIWPYVYNSFSYFTTGTWNNNGRGVGWYYGVGYDGLSYYNCQTAAGDTSGWFTVA